MRFQRKINDFAPGEWERFMHIGKIAFGGWALHYRASLRLRAVLIAQCRS